MKMSGTSSELEPSSPHLDRASKNSTHDLASRGDEKAPTEDQMRAQIIDSQRIGRRKVDKAGATSWVGQNDWEEYQRQSDSPAALQSRFAFCVDDSEMKWKIKITAPGLVEAVRKIIPPSLFETSAGGVLFQEPYSALFRYSKDLRQKLRSQHSATPEALDDFNLLVSFLEGRAEHGVWKSLEGHNQNSVTFENLWALFRDGDFLVLHDQLEQPRLFKYTRLEEQIGDEGILKGFCIGVDVHFWHISWNSGDKAFRHHGTAIRIPRFAGRRRISALPVYPMRYESDERRVAMLRELQDRGEKWSKRVSEPASCFEYAGHAVSAEAVRVRDDSDPVYIEGQVILDQTGMTGRVISDVKLLRGSGDVDYSMDESLNAFRSFKKVPPGELQFCPPQVQGYHVATGKRCLVNVNGLEPFSWETSAIQKLVLDEKRKDLLKALVTSKHDSQVRSSDIIRNKGRGLTIVLHGPPGVGKTLTAECMAAYACKPLIHLSVGDLVAFDDTIEERLTEAFETAGRLRAILLLDEADVVLEKRSFEDVRRNGIVSVFLRQLEYYNGILFMTTNRIDTMDPAFQSRIQVALQYLPLTAEKRQEIWHHLLNDGLIDCADDDKAAIEGHIASWARYDLNGRQIRNTIQLSGFAAKADPLSDGKVKLGHMQSALKDTLAFQQYFEDAKNDKENKLRTWNPVVRPRAKVIGDNSA